jgi:hypothetical protein
LLTAKVVGPPLVPPPRRRPDALSPPFPPPPPPQKPRRPRPSRARPGPTLTEAAGAGEGTPQPSTPAEKPNNNWRHLLVPPLPASPRALLPTLGAWPALQRAAQLAVANAWALAALSALRDALTFALHRLSQRATNECAAFALGEGCRAALAAAAPNPWWICLDAAFLEAFPAYQPLVALFFALALPVNVLVNAGAAAAAVVLCTSRRGADGRLMLPRRRRRAGLAAAAAAGEEQQRWWQRGRRRMRQKGDDDGDAGPLAVGPGAWWAAEPWREEQQAAAGCSFSGAGSGAGRSGAASFGRAAAAASAAAADAAPPSSSPPRIESSSDTGEKAIDNPTAALAGFSAPRLPLAPLPLGPLRGPTCGLAAAADAARAALATPGLLWRAWCADLWASAQSVPLQALALAVVPAPWAVPRLLAIQLAVPAAVLVDTRGGGRGSGGGQQQEGAIAATDGQKASPLLLFFRRTLASGQHSVRLSCALMQGFRARYAWPFVAAYALGRLVEAARDVLVATVPPRWWADVPEIPLVGTAALVAVRFLVARAVELLPLAVFLERAEAAGREGGGGSGIGGGAPA